MKEIDVENSVILSNSKLDIGNIVSSEYIGGIRFEPIKCRGFEVVSDKNRKHPNVDIELPVRGTSKAMAYDFHSPENCVINPGESKLIWTDIKAYMQDNECLIINVRSSMGKSRIFLCNTQGWIDCDYYFADNEGNIGINLFNNGRVPYEINIGDRIAQGAFMPFLVADNGNTERIRTNGHGSTGK